MPIRVLVIDDNPASLELMTYLLRAHRYEPLAAADGEAGVALAREARPGIVLCDLQLPAMDGYEVVRRLRADAATRAIPVLAVTACALPAERAQLLAAGFDGHIPKPISPEAFVPQMATFLRPDPT